MFGDNGVECHRLSASLDIRAGKVLAAMLAPPCATFSVAHRTAWALRSREFPWGLPNISHSQRELLEPGNRTARACITIMKRLVFSSIPFILEQPVGSTLRFLPQIIALVASHPLLFHEIVLDQCAFGAPYQKKTWLLCFRLDDTARLSSHQPCRGLGGLCAFSRLPHVELVGRRRTAAAAAYPAKLCDALAFALTSAGRCIFYNK